MFSAFKYKDSNDSGYFLRPMSVASRRKDDQVPGGSNACGNREFLRMHESHIRIGLRDFDH